jgi:hypothetical protein
MSFLVTMPPLSNTQYNNLLSTLFQVEEAEGAMFKVSLYSWASSSTNPIPTFTAYGSLVDGTSNDPTTFLPSFASPYNVECMWPGPSDPGDGTKVDSRDSRDRRGPQSRPIDIPSR